MKSQINRTPSPSNSVSKNSDAVPTIYITDSPSNPLQPSSTNISTSIQETPKNDDDKNSSIRSTSLPNPLLRKQKSALRPPSLNLSNLYSVSKEDGDLDSSSKESNNSPNGVLKKNVTFSPLLEHIIGFEFSSRPIEILTSPIHSIRDVRHVFAIPQNWTPLSVNYTGQMMNGMMDSNGYSHTQCRNHDRSVIMVEKLIAKWSSSPHPSSSSSSSSLSSSSSSALNVQSPLSSLKDPLTSSPFSSIHQNESPLVSIFNDKIHIEGFVLVSDLAYEKKVTIRYTTNGWMNVNTVSASYVSSISSIPLSSSSSSSSTSTSHVTSAFNSSNKWDKFRFEIDIMDQNSSSSFSSLNNQNMNEKPTLLSFAVQYQVLGNEYWANNSGRNYEVLIGYLSSYTSSSSSLLPSSSNQNYLSSSSSSSFSSSTTPSAISGNNNMDDEHDRGVWLRKGKPLGGIWDNVSSSSPSTVTTSSPSSHSSFIRPNTVTKNRNRSFSFTEFGNNGSFKSSSFASSPSLSPISSLSLSPSLPSSSSSSSLSSSTMKTKSSGIGLGMVGQPRSMSDDSRLDRYGAYSYNGKCFYPIS